MPNHSFTTFLTDITPEAKAYLQRNPHQHADLPSNAYVAEELCGARVAMHQSSTNADFPIPLHTHSYWEYIFCKQVPDMEYLVGTDRYRIRPGDIIYIPIDTPHRPLFKSNTSEPFVRDELWVSQDLADYFGRRLPNDFLTRRKNPYLFRLSGTYQMEIQTLLQNGVKETEERAHRWDNAVEGYAYLLMVTISRALLDESTQQLKQEKPELFDQILIYLQHNLSKRITLEDTAKLFFVGKSTINRIFKKHMGISFYRSLTQLRLLEAKKLIATGESLASIGEKVGFADYPTFYRAFKQEYGVSPGKFRRESQSFR